MNNNNKAFDWRTQLAVGDRGEELFMEHYPTPLVVYPEHKADFRRCSDGALIELKTDTYSLEKTENVFLERWGDGDRTKPGGPWRARRDRVSVFVYYFVRHNVWLEFGTKELCALAEKLTKKKGLVYIKNRGWIVSGYKVPIQALLPIAKVHLFKTDAVSGQSEWDTFLERIKGSGIRVGL